VRQLRAVWRQEAERLAAQLRQRPALDPAYWLTFIEAQADVFIPWLNRVMGAGLEDGAELAGAKPKPGPAQEGKAEPPIEVGINWELVNQQAGDWAEQYGYDLIKQITETTQKRVAAALNEWIEGGEAFPGLVQRINKIFDDTRRAKLIAATEATRAYAEANTIAWRDAGVWGREWRTAVDELVCPVCRPLHQQRAEMGGLFGGKIANPPAHPGCRCSLVPVVLPEEAPAKLPDEIFTEKVVHTKPFPGDNGIQFEQEQ